MTGGKPDHTAQFNSNHTFTKPCCIFANPTNGANDGGILANNGNTTKRTGVLMSYQKEVIDYLLKIGRGDLAGNVARIIYQRSDLLEALKETQIDLKIMRGNILDAAKTNDRWGGMVEVVDQWISRNDAAITKAEANQ